MNRLLLFHIGIACLLISQAGFSQRPISTNTQVIKQGEEVFEINCASCHALEEEGIGPQLGGVTEILTGDALVNFIKNPAKVIASGDPRAVALFNKYNLMMPPFEHLDASALESVVAYLNHETKSRNLKPLIVEPINSKTETTRLVAPVQKSNLRIEVEEFVELPASSTKAPRTRIATMRSHPSGDGTLLVGDQNGLIHRINRGQVNTWFDIRSRIENFVNTPGLATGLGSFAFHPDFMKNGLVYITHTEAYTGKPADYAYADSIKVALQWVLSEWKMNNPLDTVFEGSHRELLRINVPGNVHGTQEIAFSPNLSKSHPDYGMLYMGTGDGGSTIGRHPELTHNTRSLLGTIIRIDPRGTNSPNGRYGIPADNPFASSIDPLVRKEIWAYGFRNPHRLTWWDSPKGRILLSAEIGERNVEEINIVEKGQNYGWNVREGDFEISTSQLDKIYQVQDPETDKQYRKPFAQYDHQDGNAISGGYVYKGKLEALRDKYIFGDIVKGRLFYLNMDPDLSDSTIRELFITENGATTTLEQLTNTKRIDLRVSYDPISEQMFIMTKGDGKIRKITKAYFVKEQ